MYCYQADVEPGYALTDLARILGMIGQDVGYAVALNSFTRAFNVR